MCVCVCLRVRRTKFPKELPIFLDIPEFLYNTVGVGPVPKISLIHSAFSIEYCL